MISNIKKGLDSALEVALKTNVERETMKNFINKSFKLLQNWDYGFQLNQTQASIFMAYEVAFYSYF